MMVAAGVCSVGGGTCFVGSCGSDVLTAVIADHLDWWQLLENSY